MSFSFWSFLRAADNVRSVRWQRSGQQSISHIVILFSFFFSEFIVVLLLFCVKYLNGKVDYLASTLLLLLYTILHL